MKYYKISEAELIGLLNNSQFNDCLTGAGINNWEGFDFAYDCYEPIEQVPEVYEEIA